MRSAGSRSFPTRLARWTIATAALTLLVAHPAIAESLFPGPAYPTQVLLPASSALGDFNGDGRLDVVVSGDGVSIWLGQGDGTLGSELHIEFASRLSRVAVGDFDTDGFDDIAYADGRNGVVLIMSHGDGTFASPVQVNTVNPVFELTVGDLDVNGTDDLVLRGFLLAEVTILLGRGDGAFDPEQRHSICICIGITDVNPIEIDDFNLDGLPDIALGGVDIQILLGVGGGAFGPSTLLGVVAFTDLLVTGDFNGDGAPDILGNDTLVLGNGDGTFGPPSAIPLIGIIQERRAAGDLNGDGLTDFVETAFGFAQVGLGRADGTIEMLEFFFLGYANRALSLGDLNGDGLLDLVIGTWNDFSQQDVAVLAGNGDGTFGASPPLAAGDRPFGVAIGDLDNDQDIDFVASNFISDDVSVFLNRGDGSFDPQARYAAGDAPHEIVVGEFNGDQWGDVAVLNSNIDQITVFLGQGNGILGTGTGFGVLDRSATLAVGDFNEDGAQDLATHAGIQRVAQILYGTGSGAFAAPVFIDTLPCVVGSLLVGDLDADENDDLLLWGAGDACLMMGRGDGTFEAPVNIGHSGDTSGVAIGDFNDDGHPDYATTGVHTTTVSVYLGIGGGAFAPGTAYPLRAPGFLPVAGDFNDDGVIDLAIPIFFPSGPNLFSVLLGEGDGTFGPTQRFIPGFHSSNMATGDFDADGADDLVITDFFKDSVRVLLSAGANRPPVALAAGPAVTDCAPPDGAILRLDGSASSDANSTPGTNNDIVQFDWFEDFGLPAETFLGSGVTLDVTLLPGVHAITLRVTDRAGASDTDLLVVDVVAADTTPPSIAVTLSSAQLWPPNHRLIDVQAVVTASDLCGPVTLVLESIASDEPDDAPGNGDGRTVDDIRGANVGTADFLFQLRAERGANGAGRIYTVIYRATDGAGLTALAAGTAIVPHDIGGVTEPMMVNAQENGTGLVLQWDAVPGALFYNSVRGRVSDLRDKLDFFHLGSLSCIASVTTESSTVGSEDTELPSPAEAFFYLVEYNDRLASGYGTESAAKERFAPPGQGSCP